MTNYKVEIGGDEYPFLSLAYERDYSLEPQPFNVVLPTLEPISGGDIVKIYRDGDEVYRGKIYRLKKVADNEGTRLVVSGVDLKRKIGLLRMVNRRVNSDPSTQISNNLANSDLSPGTIDSYGSNIVMEYGSEDESKFTRRRGFEEICFVTGWEIFVNPAGALDFKSQCGTDLSSSIVFKRGELLQCYQEPYMINQFFKVKKVIVLGQSQSYYLIYGEAESTGYASGDPEKTINRKNLVTFDTCEKAATSLLADFENDVKLAEIQVVDAYQGKAYDVFDTVKLVDPLLDIDESLRIHHIERRVSADGGELTVLGLTNLSKLSASGPFLLYPGELFIEEGSRGADNYAKSPVPTIDIYLEREHLRFTGESTSGFTIVTDGTASVSVIAGRIRLQTGNQGFSNAEFKTQERLFHFDKNPRFKTKVKWYSNTDQHTNLFMENGNKLFGFHIYQNNELYAITQDGVSSTQQLIKNISAGDTLVLEAVLHSGRECLFYVDGKLEKRISTTLPASDFCSSLYIHHNNRAAADKMVDVFYWTGFEDWF